MKVSPCCENENYTVAELKRPVIYCCLDCGHRFVGWERKVQDHIEECAGCASDKTG